MFDYFLYPERSEGSLQSSTFFYPEAEPGITTIFDHCFYPERSEESAFAFRLKHLQTLFAGNAELSFHPEL
jgi:hypothetical protein